MRVCLGHGGLDTLTPPTQRSGFLLAATPGVAAMSRPLALSDDQLTQIMHAAAPLATRDRAAFLLDVAAALQSCDVIGDGLVGRVCRDLQRKYLHAPDMQAEPRHDRRRVS
jgi:hypothetical protein